MILRPYRSEDSREMASLFYDTVHTVNARDYTPKQLDAWAPRQRDLAAWDRSFLEHLTVVAQENGRIVGFGDMDAHGYLDRLYVHRDFQGRGIATAICDHLERSVPAPSYTVHASITAKPFFEKRGYRVVRSQQVERSQISLTNFVMSRPGRRG